MEDPKIECGRKMLDDWNREEREWVEEQKRNRQWFIWAMILGSFWCALVVYGSLMLGTN